jgi:hypothetical protein
MANPKTCNHLNVSHPRNSEAIQMNSVRQVSIVDLDVALTVLVTDSPKKLKPLHGMVRSTLFHKKRKKEKEKGEKGGHTRC